VKNQKYERGGCIKVKILIYFYKGNSRSVQLSKIKSGKVKITGTPTYFMQIIISFDEVFKYGHDAKFLAYGGQTLNHSVQFCDFAHCHISAKSLICF
jgi:hypothetical protein